MANKNIEELRFIIFNIIGALSVDDYIIRCGDNTICSNDLLCGGYIIWQ